MVGPVTIPKVGTSWHDMYDKYESYMIALSMLKCEEKCTPLGACLHDRTAQIFLGPGGGQKTWVAWAWISSEVP